MTQTARQVLLESAKAFWSELPIGVRLTGKALVYAPVFAKSAAVGVSFPDLDLVTPGIGIGGHRWAVTHSALAGWLAKRGVETIDRYIENDVTRAMMREATAAAGVGFAIGISVHLLKDAFIDEPQTIRFRIPFVGGPGTLIEGSYLDDDLWLGANGLYAFKLAGDMLAFGFGEDAREAREAFQQWQIDRAVVQEINTARAKAIEESRQLSEELREQIPTDSQEVEFPKWLRE